ncbi:M57 family metalloprotease [Pedobacter sp. NJ-S-72]
MKKQPKIIALLLLFCFCFTACKNEKPSKPEEISVSVLSKIKTLGFSTMNVLKTKGGYIVEGDIFLPDKDLDQRDESFSVKVANTEQYRTNQLVTASPERMITISVSNLPQVFSAALDTAVNRYNALKLRIRFSGLLVRGISI